MASWEGWVAHPPIPCLVVLQQVPDSMTPIRFLQIASWVDLQVRLENGSNPWGSMFLLYRDWLYLYVG